ncbi:MAG: 16S rRNA (adenine(1518)-N(6)/adenine(1519)-N(6))-dimethyltransferase RsmA [Alphaproteobacteria bacterium]|nr:16S rRNA (adenine(1518)-N(6)/adenine(1519)-N(6))-dimethyltransferase RsmA [Alphaproteobacteria bacterium]HPF46158.1 16S rRNA (adenine(1518)-N(6)/adenine(1519)-N(6))-dimethyltransferase RsmA [Emcibacteraceae bacterium]HRW30442.1 16S rRNA (adenine(1518)-N(6)/adenine(1519)-N(6))-dimethyltransferase RsmA [Emcibacteraceae bacterium]
MSSDGLPPLRDVIDRYDLRAKKSLGQNFLTDLNLTQKIARAAGNIKDAVIYEVGPGPGALTRGLLMQGAQKIIAVEMDHRCILALNEIASAYDNKVKVIEGDALDVDEAALIGDTNGKDIHVVANLPYNVGTALLVKWMTVENWLPWFKSLTLMFQKEVGERIVAKPKSKAYGRLSVLCQYRADPRILFDIPRQAFIPPPKVTSCIVQITPKEQPANAPDQKILERVVSVAFNQRRKMLRASLKGLGIDPAIILASANIKETARAEELSVEDFCRLALEYQENK